MVHRSYENNNLVVCLMLMLGIGDGEGAVKDDGVNEILSRVMRLCWQWEQ